MTKTDRSIHSAPTGEKAGADHGAATPAATRTTERPPSSKIPTAPGGPQRHAAPTQTFEEVSDRARITVIVKGSIEGSYTIGTDTLIGRGEDANIVVLDSRVSRHHARIRRGPVGFVLHDLESRNGTMVNGIPTTRGKLSYGDRIQVGEASLVFSRHDDAEAQLQELQKMEAMGRLVAGVSHDFNNLLGAILGNLGYLEGLPAGTRLGDSKASESLRDIQDAARRGVDMVAQLLGFARSSGDERGNVDLSQLTEEALRLLSRAVGSGVVVESALAPRLVVVGDASQLHQVLMNLCLNARDAMPGGGTLRVETRRLDPAAVTSRIFAEMPKSIIELVVTDTGFGMDEATRMRIFEPFFTSKAAGKGTGLGLATVYGIVKGHGGAITVDSVLGEGTTFRVLLPAVDAGRRQTLGPGTRAIKASPSAPPEVAARHCVLVVDDDPLLRRSNVRQLEQLGFRVIAAATGEEALEKVRAGGIDAVVLDLVMPGMSGDVLYGHLLEIDRRLPVVFVSGYYDDEMLRSLAERGARHFLRKPFDSLALRDSITEALELQTSG